LPMSMTTLIGPDKVLILTAHSFPARIAAAFLALSLPPYPHSNSTCYSDPVFVCRGVPPPPTNELPFRTRMHSLLPVWRGRFFPEPFFLMNHRFLHVRHSPSPAFLLTACLRTRETGPSFSCFLSFITSFSGRSGTGRDGPFRRSLCDRHPALSSVFPLPFLPFSRAPGRSTRAGARHNSNRPLYKQPVPPLPIERL